MKPETMSRLVWLLTGLLVLGMGGLEGWYGYFDYTGDALAYLDVSKAVARGDWALAFSPYWSIGYPAVLAATRWMFPAGPEGDWVSVHVVNIVIFAATYACFLYFLRVAMAFAAKAGDAGDAGPGAGFVLAAGTLVFLTWELNAANVSRIGPDLLVSTFFFLTMAVSLQFCLRPRVTMAVALGLVLGLGYLIKTIFLPLSFCCLGVMFAFGLTRGPGNRQSATARLAWALPAMALVALPYIAAMSKGLGAFTTGESGGLNYAWKVNHLICFEGWEGGPAPFGAPLHPMRLVLANPPVFEFAEPFHVTYPPWYNPYFWYEGYHHFFDLKNQIATLRSNARGFVTLFFDTPHAPVKFVSSVAFVVGSFFLFTDWRIAGRRAFALWPLWLPSIAGLAIYFVVVMMTRYLVGFFIVLFSVPFLVLFVPKPLVGRKTSYAVLAAVFIVCSADLANVLAPTLSRAVQHESYTDTEQWRVGSYLARSVVHTGEKVASVQVGYHSDNAGRTWASVSGTQIVAEIGNDAYDRSNQEKDFARFIDNPDVQQTVFTLFRQAGAELVVARNVDGTPHGPGWEPVPGTRWWVHRL